ncbi:MAG TPA: hypothetical protein VH349_16145 [Ktedonobacterales bacterium]|jgi:hypothetical protein
MSSHLVSTVTGHSIPPSGGAAFAQGEAPDWREKAVAVYADTADMARLRLRRQFSERLLALTGCVASEGTIAVDIAGRSASAVVDGALFLLRRDDLVIVRPCAYCGTGRFVSEPLERQVDLGYALAGWAPYHRDCEPVDAPDDVSW